MNQNLTQGAIIPSLLRLALPIMGMSFVQMAYNMVDMIWLGRVGAGAVAAVGTATFFHLARHVAADDNQNRGRDHHFTGNWPG